MEEPFLHGLAEGTGGFAGDDSDGACCEVELFPPEVAYISESLPECAYAAADGRGPFIRQLVDEEVYFFKSKGIVYNFFIAAVCGHSDVVAGVASDDFRILGSCECRTNGRDVFAACGSAHLVPSVYHPLFNVGFGDEPHGSIGSLT